MWVCGLGNVSRHNGYNWRTGGVIWTSADIFLLDTDWTLAQVGQEDIQKPLGLDPAEQALGDLAWQVRLDKRTFRGLFQTHPFCDSV